MKTADSILAKLDALADPAGVAGMARFGINPANARGVRIPVLRKMAREAGRDHALARALWASKVHEARILAGMVEEVERVTAAQMERWVKDFSSWDLCDQTYMNCFRHTSYAWEKVYTWAERDAEYVRRAGFALIATLAVHDDAPDQRFIDTFSLMEAVADDPRNYVKKAVNWALRQIGKRNLPLHTAALEFAEALLCYPEKSAQWIAKDALRELSDAKTIERIRQKG